MNVVSAFKGLCLLYFYLLAQIPRNYCYLHSLVTLYSVRAVCTQTVKFHSALLLLQIVYKMLSKTAPRIIHEEPHSLPFAVDRSNQLSLPVICFLKATSVLTK